MNGLNGDRFVTGTLTRPFSRPFPPPDTPMHESRLYMIFTLESTNWSFWTQLEFDQCKSTKNIEYHAIRTLKLWKSMGLSDPISMEKASQLLKPNLTARNWWGIPMLDFLHTFCWVKHLHHLFFRLTKVESILSRFIFSDFAERLLTNGQHIDRWRCCGCLSRQPQSLVPSPDRSQGEVLSICVNFLGWAANLFWFQNIQKTWFLFWKTQRMNIHPYMNMYTGPSIAHTQIVTTLHDVTRKGSLLRDMFFQEIGAGEACIYLLWCTEACIFDSNVFHISLHDIQIPNALCKLMKPSNRMWSYTIMLIQCRATNRRSPRAALWTAGCLQLLGTSAKSFSLWADSSCFSGWSWW